MIRRAPFRRWRAFDRLKTELRQGKRMTYPDGAPYTEADTRTKLINPALYDVAEVARLRAAAQRQREAIESLPAALLRKVFGRFEEQP